tara:strand:- start:1139 stop:1501 length:363 start_codon:yes stop_codon:yes gene_type:complete
MKYLLVLLLMTGCSSPQKTLDLLTPDTFGVGQMNGSISGWSHGWQDHHPDIHLESDFDQESTFLYLEWNLPEWKRPQRRDDSATIIYLENRLRELEEAEAKREAMSHMWLEEIERNLDDV